MTERGPQKYTAELDRNASKLRLRRKDANNNHGQDQPDWQRYRQASAYMYAKELEHIRVEMVAMYVAANKHEVCFSIAAAARSHGRMHAAKRASEALLTGAFITAKQRGSRNHLTSWEYNFTSSISNVC